MVVNPIISDKIDNSNYDDDIKELLRIIMNNEDRLDKFDAVSIYDKLISQSLKE